MSNFLPTVPESRGAAQRLAMVVACVPAFALWVGCARDSAAPAAPPASGAGFEGENVGAARPADRVIPPEWRAAEAANDDGMQKLKAGEWAEAAQAFERAVAAQPGFGDGWFNLAIARENAGNPAGALAALDRAVPLQPGRREIGARRTALLCRLGRCEGEGAPRDADGLLAASAAAADAGRYVEALRMLHGHLRAADWDARVALRYAEILIRQERPGEALKLLEQVRRHAPETKRLAVQFGFAHFALGEFEAARAAAREGLTDTPGEAQMLLGRVAAAERDYAAAEAAFEAAERAADAPADLPLLVAQMHAGLGNTDKALAALDRVPPSRMDPARRAYHRGVTLARAGRAAAAVTELRRFMELVGAGGAFAPLKRHAQRLLDAGGVVVHDGPPPGYEGFERPSGAALPGTPGSPPPP